MHDTMPDMCDMPDIAISQLTTIRWDLAADLECLREQGFSTLAMWRPKLSDRGVAATRAALAEAGVRCSSLHCAGGFTGVDGRTFRESLADADDAIAEAAELAAPVLIVHSGCRGGHTRSHAGRLLREALAILGPTARRRGVVLALKPVHPAAACGCSFLTDLAETLELVESIGDPAIRLSLDTWQFEFQEEIERLLPRLVAAVAIVQVADRSGPPTLEFDRLPPGYGGLPLETIVSLLWEHGYRGDFEFDPVGETVELLGYAGTVGEILRVTDSWRRQRIGQPGAMTVDQETTGKCANAASPGLPAAAVPVANGHVTGPQRPPFHLRGGPGSRRSQASSQAVSRG